MPIDMTATLAAADPEIAAQIDQEILRQHEGLEMIASENFVSRAVLEAAGTVFTNKYAEGYPGKRYYGGCEFADVVENLARDRAKQPLWRGPCQCAAALRLAGQRRRLHDAARIPATPSSASTSRTAATSPTATSSTSPASSTASSATRFAKDTEVVDYDQLEEQAVREKPKMIIGGGSAYPRQFDFARMREIADKVGA